MIWRTRFPKPTYTVFNFRKNRDTILPLVEDPAKGKDIIKIFNGFLTRIVRLNARMIANFRFAFPVDEEFSDCCISLVNRKFQEGGNAALIRF